MGPARFHCATLLPWVEQIYYILKSYFWCLDGHLHQRECHTGKKSPSNVRNRILKKNRSAIVISILNPHQYNNNRNKQTKKNTKKKQQHKNKTMKQCSRARFWSSDLWVMGPARFHCATLLFMHKNQIEQLLQNRMSGQRECHAGKKNCFSERGETC